MTTGDTSEGNGRYTEVIDLFDKENVCQMVQKSDYPFEVMKATGQAVKVNNNHTDFVICGGIEPSKGKVYQFIIGINCVSIHVDILIFWGFKA